MDTNKLLPAHQTQRNWHTPSPSGTSTLAQSVHNIAIDDPVDLSINSDNVEPSTGLETDIRNVVSHAKPFKISQRIHSIGGGLSWETHGDEKPFSSNTYFIVFIVLLLVLLYFLVLL